MNYDKLKNDIQVFLENKHTRWTLGNQILYDLCENYPSHTDKEVIITKLWLIGRSYAAALERVKGKKNDNEDFYYDVFYPQFGEDKGKKLKEIIEDLDGFDHISKENLNKILYSHKFLLNQFEKITDMKNRSLASKYLHFHCPNLFYIYDSRASKKISKYITLDKSDKLIIDDINKYDHEYAIFVLKAFKLQSIVHEEHDRLLTPREIDNFLLGY